MSKRFNLSQAQVMLVDDSPPAADVLSQVLMGFGVNAPIRCTSAEDAQTRCQAEAVDLILCDGEMPGFDGYEFVRWLRRSKLDPNSYCPVIILAAHTPTSKIEIARDCGASFFVAKPLSPAILLDRILFVARNSRPFIECDTYMGPDRRFRVEGPPKEGDRRRDAKVEALAKTGERELSQDEINGLFDKTGGA